MEISSVNFDTFIRPNQEQLRTMQLYKRSRGNCSNQLSYRAQLSSSNRKLRAD